MDLDASHAASLAANLGESFYIDEESVRLAARTKTSFNLVHLASGIKVDIFVRKAEP